MGIGFTELLLIATLFLALPIIIVALMIYLIVASTKEWDATYEGHRIVLQNRLFSEKLYIDGAVVDSHSGIGFNTTLRGRIERADDGVAVVEGRIRQGTLGLSIKGHILIDGALIGGDAIAS